MHHITQEALGPYWFLQNGLHTSTHEVVLNRISDPGGQVYQ